MRRSARGDSRVDGVLLAVALLFSVVARALPEPRADRVSAALRRTVLSPLMSLQDRAERARRALSSQDSVLIAGDSVLLRGFDAERLHAENDRLRKMLGLGARLRNGFVPAEAIHGPALGEPYTLVLNAGTQAGVDSFSPVIAPEGVVGYIRSAGPLSSVAITWPHPDFRVSAMAVTGSAAGIVSAHPGDGASRFMLELRDMPMRAPLPTGTLIVSSGIGGTFPRGIPIGTVVSQLPSGEGWARNYLLLPSVRPADVGAVLVLTAARARTDMSSVWAQPDSAPAALKRVVAAGDSLTKAVAKPPPRDTVRHEP